MSQLWLVPDQVEQYIAQWTPDDIFTALREETVAAYSHQKNKRKFPIFNKLGLVKSDKSWMMISPDMISFLQNMVRATKAKRCLDLGTFTGMSALAMALALGNGGEVITCDVDSRPVAIARRFWVQAGVDGLITSHILPAQDLMQKILDSGQTVDLVFIDAQDRMYYDEYYELALQIIRPGGVILFDNAFMFGHVMDSSSDHRNGKIINTLNEKIKKDSRVNSSLLSISDGVLWLVKV